MKFTTKKYSWCLVIVLLLSGGFSSVANAGPKKKKPAAPPKAKPKPKPIKFSHDAVMKAIDRGVEALWKRRNKDGVWTAYGNSKKGNYYPTGPTSIAAYALLESGVSPMDSRMEKILDWLEANNDKMTYSMGFRANAWKIANQKTGGKYKKQIIKDRKLFLKSIYNGRYGYRTDGKKRKGYDNSTSQYGVLGIWAIKQAGMEIPRTYWQQVLAHWVRDQGKDGGWAYYRSIHPYGTKLNKDKKKQPRWQSTSTAAMSTAGLASLFICMDNILAMNPNKRRGGIIDYKPIKRGLNWFDKNFPKTMKTKPSRIYYYLYGVERIGLASGYKYFGKSNWYKAGATVILNAQRKDGNWGGRAYQTAYALLFLLRGKYPVVFNKLEYKGDWNNNSRDMASLTRWMGNTFEKTFSWQIIHLRVPVSEMHDAPFLYINGSEEPEFTDKELAKLRTFVYQGGTIFCVSAHKTSKFCTKMREIYGKLFPRYELTKCEKDHPIYSAYFNTKGTPELYIMSNGIRPLVIHCDNNLSRIWQTGFGGPKKKNFEFGVNMTRYVVGRFENLRPRGVSHWPAAKKVRPTKTLRAARLKFSGNNNPEPLAYQRFATLMAQKHNTRIVFAKPKTPVPATKTNRVVGGVVGGDMIPISELPGSKSQVALMEGTASFSLSQKDIDILKKWVNGGGTLVCNAVGGSKTFAKAAKKLLAQMYEDNQLVELPVDSKIYTLKDLNIGKVKYRASQKRVDSRQRPSLMAIMLKNRPAIILSQDDITAGLVGYPSGLVNGYKPEDAFDIMRNIMLIASPPPPQKK